jgi:hypothetical protein
VASNSNPTKGNNETEHEAGREAVNDCLRVKSGLPLAWAEPRFSVSLLRKHTATAAPPFTPGRQHCSAIWRSLESTPPPLPAKLSRIDLLVIDEWAMGAVKRMGAS